MDTNSEQHSTTWGGRSRSLAFPGLLAALLALSAPLLGQPLYLYQHDSVELYAFMGAAGRVLESTTSAGIEDQYWDHEFTHSQTRGSGSIGDSVDIRGTLRHVIAPHGEPPNRSLFPYHFHVDAGNVPLGHGWVQPVLGGVPHGPHFDAMKASLRWWTAARPGGGQDLLAHVWMVVGKHTDRQHTWRGGHFIAGPGGDEGRTSEVIGSAYLLVEPEDGRAALAVAVTGLRRPQLRGGRLVLESPAAVAFQVVDLAPREWVDLGPEGLALVLPEIKLEAALGRAYVEVVTSEPNGTIRAELEEEDGSPEGAFRRGDADGNGLVDQRDAEFILEHLHRDGMPPPCPDAADTNDDGQIDVTDAQWILAYLDGRIAIPAPGPVECGPDLTPDGLSSLGYPDDACVLLHCCLPDGTCVLTCRECCSAQGGRPVPECKGDGDGNGIDDACEAEPEPEPEPVPPPFIRGDANGDGDINITDVVYVINELFRGAPPSRCPAAADANGDGTRDISDPIYILQYTFLGGRPPPEPFPRCGVAPADETLPCLGTIACGGCDCKKHRPQAFTLDELKVTSRPTPGTSRLTVKFTVSTTLECQPGAEDCEGKIEVKTNGGTMTPASAKVTNQCGAAAAVLSQSFTYVKDFDEPWRDLTYTLKLEVRTECRGRWLSRTSTIAVVSHATDPDRVDEQRSDLDGDGKTPAQGDTDDSTFDDADGDGLGDGNDPQPDTFNDRDGDGVGDGYDPAPGDPSIQ
jgi:hypothetical protein